MDLIITILPVVTKNLPISPRTTIFLAIVPSESMRDPHWIFEYV